MSRRKKLLFSVILTLMLVLGEVLAEGVLRIVQPSLAEAYAAPIDPGLGYGITHGHHFTLNRFGLRESNFPVKRPSGETRVLCLGDSITFGYGLPEESAWPKILEKNVRELNGNHVFCINAAGNAATPHEALDLYEAPARSFGASSIVLGFCMNDVRLRQHQNDVRSVGLERRGAGLRAWRYQLRKSYLFSVFDLSITEITKRYLYPLSGKSWLETHPYQLNSLGMTPVAERAWADTLTSLDELRRQVSREGADLMLVAFPYQFQISNTNFDNPYGIDKARFAIDPFKRLKIFCDQRGITYVDLQAVFASTRHAMIEKRLAWHDLYIYYCHPNETGQALAAQAVFNKLVETRSPAVTSRTLTRSPARPHSLPSTEAAHGPPDLAGELHW